MKHPQVINLNEDSVLAFIGNDVLESVTQIPMYEVTSSLIVDMKLWDLMDNAAETIEGLAMTYSYDSRFWTMDVDGTPSLKNNLKDRHKYVGTVYGNTAETENLEPFQITEFAVDNESLDAVLMRMPYEIDVSGGEAWFFWYEAGHQGSPGYERFSAPAYEGGTGTTYATDASRVTHRGPVEPVFTV